MLENIKLSFQGIWSHKMRSLLTMLGIIIGISSVIMIISVGNGVSGSVSSQYYVYFDALNAVTDLYDVENRDEDDIMDDW